MSVKKGLRREVSYQMQGDPLIQTFTHSRRNLPKDYSPQFMFGPLHFLHADAEKRRVGDVKVRKNNKLKRR